MAEESNHLWVFLGAQMDVSRDGGPSLSAPSTHTRIFLRRAAVELEAKDTLCKPEFHSLLAKSGFLPGEGVRTPARARVCVYTHACTRTQPRAPAGGQAHEWGVFAETGWGPLCFPALGLDGTWKACPEEFRQIPGVNDSETCRLVVVERGSSLEQSRQNMPLNLKARIFCKIIQKVC